LGNGPIHSDLQGGQDGVSLGHDAGVSCLWHAALTLWHGGYPDQARQRIRAMLTLAQDFEPYSLADALTFAAVFHQYCRDWHLTQEMAEKAITLSDVVKS
jgi:hypothetical protein